MTRKQGNEPSEKPQKQRTPQPLGTFLAVCALYRFLTANSLSSSSRFPLPRSVAELDPGELALPTVDQSLKCSVQTWPAGILGTTQNCKTG